jgi:hypothetical protein
MGIGLIALAVTPGKPPRPELVERYKLECGQAFPNNQPEQTGCMNRSLRGHTLKWERSRYHAPDHRSLRSARKAMRHPALPGAVSVG